MSNIVIVNNSAYFDGCFTFESGILGLNIKDIGRRLGLPLERLSQGVDIYYALTIPSFDEFYWGGMALDATDNFITYPKGQAPQYNMKKFGAKSLCPIRHFSFRHNTTQFIRSRRMPFAKLVNNPLTADI